MSDLDSIIEDAITDAEIPLETPEIDTPALDDVPELSPEPTTTDSTPNDPPAGDTTAEVQSPAARAAEAPKGDDFEKRFGIAQNSSSGRENRIPYSRVRKITEKAEKDTDTRIRSEYAPKLTEFETKVKDYETKVADYEGRLRNVAQIEHMMANDHVGFLQTLIDKVPGYAQILAPLYQQQAPATTAQPPADTKADPTFPQPDVDLPDGTKVYSMGGLDKLNKWNREQARQEAVAEIDKKYGKILESYQAYEQQRTLLPKVEAQINEARKWPQFQENEQEITRVLQANPRLSLEGAYRHVVIPHLTQAQSAAKTDQAKLEQEIRAKILAEMKNTPRSTSAQASTTRPNTRATSSGPRSIESIIEEQIKTIK